MEKMASEMRSMERYQLRLRTQVDEHCPDFGVTFPSRTRQEVADIQDPGHV
jgi:hypothetical protein